MVRPRTSSSGRNVPTRPYLMSATIWTPTGPWKFKAQSRRFEVPCPLIAMAAGAMPDWLEPMAATLTQERFAGPDWVFERKFDGIRLLAYKEGGLVRLYSRNQLLQHCPRVAAAIAALPMADAIFDGELDWHGDTYHLFDVLWLD